ncbi:serine/threonine protein kinase [Bifidobacterium sp. 82T24]|uniref:serine/threonine-protein kinase n=1 Tax=Bifidobacterium pluvialisilvae TaxID=2834436 RepID=UPI001C57D756|nr:serine/threonine-protein kinase [Bifidobacterium pluvialisilvae]MBW3088054.1 serine/threonine protein kinase [Bifidobacterium pluvialisilvae]
MSVNVEPPVLEGYDFIRTLGAGGTAAVFLYHQRVPNRLVAVKINETPLADRNSRNRFRSEANFMAQLSEHPYILSIYDAGITPGGRGYMVLEYARGGSYKDLSRSNQLPVDQVLTVGIDLASALFTAHKRGIIHRDIKPSNVLISTQGLPVIADFGISSTIYTTRGAKGFSIPWAPPEVLTGRSGGSEATDIYSLGATLFAMLVGRSPFEYGYKVKDTRELAQVIVDEDLPRIRRADVPKEFEKVLRRAMNKNPDARYYSMLEFARDMQRVQQQCYGHQTPVTVEDVPPYLPQQRRRGRQATDAAGPAAPQPRTWVRPLAIGASIVAAVAVIAALLVFVVMPRLDSARGADGTQVVGDDAKGLDSHDDPSPGLGATADSDVPSPTGLAGTLQDGTATFTWTNPDPQNGDRYAWNRVGSDSAQSDATSSFVDRPTVSIDGVTDDQVCIQVSIVRADRQMSTTPATACAVRK